MWLKTGIFVPTLLQRCFASHWATTFSLENVCDFFAADLAPMSCQVLMGHVHCFFEFRCMPNCNPLVFPESGDFLSGGNFHGMPLAIALDTLRIALVHIAGIAERRVYWVLSGHDTENPVTCYLAPEPGMHSGYMIAQYTAAACCNARWAPRRYGRCSVGRLGRGISGCCGISRRVGRAQLLQLPL